ncbi:DUF6622 family protein [Rhizobium sp. L1K21]|uniref:DUF6622 family protein n=1 Tax=Rhizobium sp. L1K21 TaxID=2954933 RepID=UPI002092A661|nr:hypothetical protein [Rhizobium sp. L1K21]MCO6188069.1 hypothetical protein [Rhizobium sp. L1K21]
MQFLVGIVTHTPIWVWAILAALVYRGWTMTRDRVIHPISLMLIPAIFILLDAVQLIARQAGNETLLLTLIGILSGLWAVVFLKPARNTQRLADGKLAIEGEWISICIFLAVFSGNYIAGVLAVINPAVATNAQLAAALFNGFSVGFMTSRAIAHLRSSNTGEVVSSAQRG